MPKAPPYLYEKLTWPEINDAIEAGKIPIIPVGSIEQHGPHLPLDVDCVLPRGVALRAAEQMPDKALIFPVLPLGYVGHVMDYPGTVNLHYQHFINMIVDVGKSLAYHGFKKMIFLNGHGSNMPNLDLATRRIGLETDADCMFCAWWSLLTVAKDGMSKWRESEFPGGCAHAGELETSMYLYLNEENVRKEHCANGPLTMNQDKNPFFWVDLFAAGPVSMSKWTSQYMGNGTGGAAHLGTAEKGRIALEEAASQLVQLVEWFAKQPREDRVDRHKQRPTFGMPWGQDAHEPEKRDATW